MQASNNKVSPIKKVEVVIGGKVYKLTGSESEEYIQSVARYINKKLVELSKHSSAGLEFSESYPILLALNIADDLFKERNSDKKEEEQDTTPADKRAMEEATEAISELNAQLVEKTREIEAVNKAVSERDAMISKYKTAMQNGSIQFKNFEKTISEQKTEIERLRNKLSVANSDIANLTSKSSDTAIELGELNKKINAKNQELNSLSVKLSEKNNALNELNKKSAERNQKLNNVNKERDELAIKLKEANGIINSLNNQISDIAKSTEGANDKHASEMKSANDKINTLTAQLEEKDKAYAELKRSIPQDGAENLQNALNAVKAENKELSHQNEQLIQELTQAKNELKSFINAFN